jgi:hypothetical protein
VSYDPENLDKLLDALAKEGRLQPGADPEEHTDSATLYAYSEDELSPEQRSLVEEHLSLCGRCRDLLVEYREFLGGSPEEEAESERRGRVADFGAAAEWQKLQARMREEERKSQPSSFHRFFGSAKTAYSIAAMLALALIGLSLYVASLRRAMNEPDLNSPWLEPSGSTRSVSTVIAVPANEEKTLVFDLPAPEEELQGEYRLEIDFNGERIFGPGELELQNEGDDFFTVTWRSSALKSGRYDFRVLRLQDGRLKQVGKYTYTISKQ